MSLVRKKIKDEDILFLIKEVIDSFGQGVPLGNLTSQIFANIYLNELDKFVKHQLKIKYYLRYADDFVILDSTNNNYHHYTSILVVFLGDKLKLKLHPNKISLRKLSWGIDFCGYIVLPRYILPRAKTKKRILKKIGREKVSKQSLQSYLGYLSHAKSFKDRQNIKNLFWLLKKPI